MTCPYTIDIAAYVLDALEPAEAQRLREHLAGCPGCLPAYDELSGLPTLLDHISPADVDDVPAELSDALRDTLLTRAAARPSRRVRRGRRMFGVAAGAVAVTAGIATGIALPRDHPPAPEAATVAATDPGTWVHASITLTAQTWGTQIRVRLSGVRWAQRCILLVTAADGRSEVAATWVANYRGAFNVAGTTAIPERQIHELDVITTSGVRLVTVPAPAH
ncbi:MAG TPA: anti-sigma factor [Pseudonocardiaceae bacterium]|jgi:hypothetical protein|nr:anti-sigma factor [Pseudonocardiaceae bacterium]